MTDVCKYLIILIFTTSVGHCGLLTGDLKLKSRPLSINSHHAPINININTDKFKAALPSLSLPKPAKPPPKDLTDLLKNPLKPKSSLSSLLSLKSSKLHKLPSLSKSILGSKSLLPSLSSPKLSRSSIFSESALPSLGSSKLSSLSKSSKLPSLSSLTKPKLSPLSKLSAPRLPLIPPIIPKVPFLPLPLLPPLIPPLPLLPLIPPIIPGLPLIPPIINPLKPLRVPILGRQTLLQKALGSELSPVVIDIRNEKKSMILEKKLRNLVKRGSLTAAEFKRFRKLLLD